MTDKQIPSLTAAVGFSLASLMGASCSSGAAPTPTILRSPVPVRLAGVTEPLAATSAPPPPNPQALPPGTVRGPGEQCATSPQPPQGEACVQPDDLHCTGTNRQIGQCMAARWGWFDSEWDHLDHRITDIENHDWNPTLWNSGGSGAYGIPQSCPAGKMSGPNYVEVPGGGYQGDWHTDPYIQVAWLRRYVRDRYGSPYGIPEWGGY